nr:MotA/TolQ/ExbB proton channel family protein [Shimia biformata]
MTKQDFVQVRSQTGKARDCALAFIALIVTLVSVGGAAAQEVGQEAGQVPLSSQPPIASFGAPDAPPMPSPTMAAPAENVSPTEHHAETPGEATAGQDDGARFPDTPAGTVPGEMHAVPVSFSQTAARNTVAFLRNGGPSIWAISALSVVTLTLILWKIWRLALVGAWSKGRALQAVRLYQDGSPTEALAQVAGRPGVRSKVVSAAIGARRDLGDDDARAETGRVARKELAEASTGLRALELIATIAPLLGLLGTVLGMIAAFKALQEAGSRADPALLAGGIWEALLTTAAGMAVAIPASVALSWFEAVIDRMRRDVEDAATRIFIAPKPPTRPKLAAAAE